MVGQSRGSSSNQFQFTPLREGRRPAPCKGRLRGSYFNSRPSARGDPSAAPRELVLDFISIHAPPRGATQQARSHRRAVPISIHAPPRGATFPSIHLQLTYCISIHAPPRGATANVQPLLLGDKFQFTPLREGRLIPKEKWQFGRDFNSRPSARGDGAFQATTGCTPYFNSRPSARGDVKTRFDCADSWTFQFTPLREGRRSSRHPHVASVFDFNSRPSARGDAGCITVVAVNSNFNSRPSARGDSCVFSILLFIFVKFQFTPLREGRRPFRGREVLFRRISIHAPPRGATRLAEDFGIRVDISIHAPPRGATGVSFSCLLWLFISIHAPPRGATARNVRR